MVGYTTFGTNDIDRARSFFNHLFGEFGIKPILDNDRMVLWGKGLGDGMFAICKPFDEQPATVGNGVMVALRMDDRAAVDRLHAKALELGAADEGAPGQRNPNFYGAYFRDLDGNKFCGFVMGM
jgi:predicted lactoylglutathione lyase